MNTDPRSRRPIAAAVSLVAAVVALAMVRTTTTAASRRRSRTGAVGACAALGLCTAFQTNSSSSSGTGTIAVSAFDVSSDVSKWYTRYPAYPEQCSTPSQMADRSVPPLSNDPAAGGLNTKLLHVTAVFRHGARTAHPGKKCWEGYRESVETGHWDCNLTSVAGISPATLGFATTEGGGNIDGNAGNDGRGSGGGVLVENRYDAFALEGQQRRTNSLAGTCLQNQLLARGALQGRTLGEHLRNAYTYTHSDDDNSDGAEENGGGSSADERRRMHLLPRDVDVSKDEIYVRSDDFQRTIMTAHAVLSGLLVPDDAAAVAVAADSSALHKNGSSKAAPPPPPTAIIPLHLAEQDRDVFLPTREQHNCPRLADIMARAEAWPERLAFRASRDVRTTNDFLRNEMPRLWDDPNECLMSVMCADLGVPEAIDDYGWEEEAGVAKGTAAARKGSKRTKKLEEMHGKYGPDILRRVVHSDVTSWAMRWQYNDGEYAKLNMAPVWAEIMANVRPVVANNGAPNTEEEEKTKAPKNKMALFSAHDSTVMQLLIALGKDVWDGRWTPYAGAMIIEIHELTAAENDDDDDAIDRSVYTTDRAFRLLYNGRVLTSKVDGCPPEPAQLCDARILLERVEPFANFHPDCSRLEVKEDKDEDGADKRKGRGLRDGIDDDYSSEGRRARSDGALPPSREGGRSSSPTSNDGAATTLPFVSIASASVGGAILGSAVTIFVTTIIATRRRQQAQTTAS